MSTNVPITTNIASVISKVPDELLWLADSPLFIDEDQVSRFYDAVVRPESNAGTTTLQITEETIKQIKANLGIEASLSTTELLAAIAHVFAFVKPEIKASAEGEGQLQTSKENSATYEFHPISTPQRQLVHLALHYFVNLPDRVFFLSKPSSEHWRKPETISKVPRELVFLNLPGQDEAIQSNAPETKIIPTAAEFASGKVVTFFDKLEKESGEKPPIYPEGKQGQPLDEIRQKRKEYWRWFDKNFRATKAMMVVENAVSEHGRINWIDYRVPLTNEGDTLHLHVCPSGKYDAGVFAYNFIKRGYKHGLRLVGTLRSEPSMNVLAIYDK
jgi:hypothetical protein